jgi:hypothetical protein
MAISAYTAPWIAPKIITSAINLDQPPTRETTPSNLGAFHCVSFSAPTVADSMFGRDMRTNKKGGYYSALYGPPVEFLRVYVPSWEL